MDIRSVVVLVMQLQVTSILSTSWIVSVNLMDVILSGDDIERSDLSIIVHPVDL